MAFPMALLVPVMAAGVISLGSTQAADDFWNSTGPASWTIDSNWLDTSAPTSTDQAIIKNGGEATVTSGDAITVQNLRFINGTLTMSGGSIANTSDTVRIGDYVFDATAGTATLNMSGSSSITGNTRVYIADGNNAGSTVSTANVNLSGSASITGNDQYLVIGRQGGTAVVNLYDDAIIEKKGTNNSLIIGDGNLGIGTVTLHDNSSLKSSTEYWIGNGSGAIANLNISGNSTVTKTGTGGYITAGRSGSTGTITVSGSGKLISENSIRIAEGSTANGTIIANDNAIIQASNAVQVGYQGTGKLEVSSSAQVTVGGELSVGISSGKGSLLMSGGTLNANGTGTYVVGGGASAQATVTLSGTSVLNGANMKWKTGDFGGTGNAGSTEITLNDSASLTLREFTIGHIGGASASENVTLNGSSSLTVNDFITIGRDDSTTNGSMIVHLNLNGGTLSTKSIRAGGGTSSATNNNIIANGGIIRALADEADFFQPTANNSTRTYVKIENGGLGFHTNGHNVAIQTELHAGDTSGGGLTKLGSGTLTLTVGGDYTGATTVNEGTLALGAGASIASSQTIQLAPGSTLDVSAQSAWSLAIGQTMVGNGSVIGSTIIASGAVIAPGNSIGATSFTDNLTLLGTANMEVENGANDTITVAGALTYGGILNLINIGGPITGYGWAPTTFDLFDFSSQSGTFDSIVLPTLDEGYSWTEFNYSTGSISVIPEPTAALLGSLGLLALLRRRR